MKKKMMDTLNYDDFINVQYDRLAIESEDDINFIGNDNINFVYEDGLFLAFGFCIRDDDSVFLF